MAAPGAVVDLAFTYAWWLTGDAAAAESAVLRAAEHLAATAKLNGSSGHNAVMLLEAVRSDAIRERTMCPASELALLHDAQGLDLPDAARLACIDPTDATVELAHGRLEALLETVREPFAHPERLGGLAVGNPPDIAHARQCASCGEVSRLLQRGRQALRELPPPRVPDDLADLLALLEPRGEPSGEAAPEAPSEAASGTRVLQFDDLDPYVAPAAVPANRPRHGWLLPAVVLLAVLLLAVTALATLRTGGGANPSGASPQPTGPPPSSTPASASPAASPEPASPPPSADPATPARFHVTELGLLRLGEFVPAGPGITLTRTDRVRIAVRYAGAADTILLRAHWTIEGTAYRELAVGLAAADSQHVFTAPVPDEGWPPGLHQVVLTVGEDVVGNVDFRVV